MKNTFYILILLCISLLFNGCKGEAGDTGLIGPKGEKGKIGAAGDPGVAEIFATNWISITKAEQIKFYDPDLLYTSQGFSGGELDKLSQKILDDGVILSYHRWAADKARIISLPNVIDYGNVESGLQISRYIAAYPKGIDCFVEFSKSVDINKYLADEEYRFIIIPGASGYRLQNIDFNNYEAVKKALNLKD
ncbi:collagen-like protein [Emticicia sp. BO119]|uniref:collagen-like triple helix repeat-containing protein n=1 Tax=Emticicia sp. BO119 TaxID=2757768 RepID=UPI0015F08CB8|nr:collagen-like protein [Emticicia sp. BO119]MBA4853885.1 collagen-like protein [Emticicia sp. BO119]